MGRKPLALLQGTLDVLVLSALSAGPRHGYAVVRWIRDRSGEALEVEEGALYNSLHRMERKRWVRSTWGFSENNRRAKYYELTAAGQERLERETRTWSEYAAAVSSVLGSGADGA